MADDFAQMDDAAFLAERTRVRETIEALSERYRLINKEFARREAGWPRGSAGHDPQPSPCDPAGPTARGGTAADETARPRVRRSLLDRVDAFTRRHPEFTIAAPYSTLSKLWEVRSGNGTAQWDNGFRMMDDLEARYPR